MAQTTQVTQNITPEDYEGDWTYFRIIGENSPEKGNMNIAISSDKKSFSGEYTTGDSGGRFEGAVSLPYLRGTLIDEDGTFFFILSPEKQHIAGLWGDSDLPWWGIRS